MCIDIIEIGGGERRGAGGGGGCEEFSSILTELSASHTTVAGYYRFTFYL